MDGMWNEPAEDEAFPPRPDLSPPGAEAAWAFPELPAAPGERPRRGRAALAAVLAALTFREAREVGSPA